MSSFLPKKVARKITAASVLIVLTITISAPQPTYAIGEDLNHTEKLNLIEILLNQLALLQQQVASIHSNHTAINNPDAFEKLDPTIYPSTFAAVYDVTEKDASLSLVHGTYEIHAHKKLWQEVRTVLGTELITMHITELRLFHDASSSYTAFVYKLEDGSWMLALNTALIDLRPTTTEESLEYTIVHEFGHILTESKPRKERAFIETFWNDRDFDNANRAIALRAKGDLRGFWDMIDAYVRENSDEFLTPYGATSPYEDLAETFTHTVFYGVPNENTERAKKVAFLLNDPHITYAYHALRQNLSLESHSAY